jgi:hypothetical protein
MLMQLRRNGWVLAERCVLIDDGLAEALIVALSAWVLSGWSGPAVGFWISL